MVAGTVMPKLDETMEKDKIVRGLKKEREKIKSLLEAPSSLLLS